VYLAAHPLQIGLSVGEIGDYQVPAKQSLYIIHAINIKTEFFKNGKNML